MARCPQRCPECFCKGDDTNLPVPGQGPTDAEVMCIGEGPGKQERNMHLPFVGKTGEELNNTYLPLSGLSRSDVYVSNAFRCSWAESKDVPPDHIVRSCAEFHLRRELNQIKPRVVVLMGGIANSLIGRKVDIHHGTAVEADLLGHRVLCYSSFHPARGLHQSSTMQQLLDDFRRLKLFLRGDLPLALDTCPNPSYYQLKTADEVDAVLAHRLRDKIAVDTESSKTWKGYKNTIHYVTYCSTFCLDEGEAFLVMRSDKAAWDRLGYWLVRWRGKILCHNLPHDWRAFDQCGVQLPWERSQDTMAQSYVLANLAKGLKPLAYQLLSSSARSFDDVVRPYGIRAVMEYIADAAMREWPAPEQEETGEFVTKVCPNCDGKTAIKTITQSPCVCGNGSVEYETKKGNTKVKKCPMCKGKAVINTATYQDCTCDGGYVTVPKMTRKQGLGQKLNRLITDYINNGMSDDFDPWERLNGWDLAIQPMIDEMGPPPLDSVDLVPVDELLDYAASDAHNCLRIEPIMSARMVDLRRRKYT